MGEGGNLTLGLSSTSGFAGALFFDDYPYSPLVHGSHVNYGSMQRLLSSDVAECFSARGMTAVKISSTRAQPLSINEIQLFDQKG
eukprot:CAMPEP_0194121662 /NCGR_PEP_ID=MMETSP0150-20130528/47864_1 /TAXON_ID=122233 /ORGANISM="Chaetoceros debilis, Strain MM31A-1" /LENGTH=84 /DNA_ID=CAMNT_0038814197 /DNA_START=1 /DNA_END=252 /DNA_ORIENTATION=-